MRLGWFVRINHKRRERFLFTAMLVAPLGLASAPAKADSQSCWPIIAEWEMCSEGQVQEFHPGKSEPFFAAMHGGQFVASGWTFREHPEDIIRLGDRALWRKIKLKLIADLEEMGEDYRSVTRHGVEFIEWSFVTGDEKTLLSSAMINDREALITTLTISVPDDFDIVGAHEVFMKNTRLRPNE